MMTRSPDEIKKGLECCAKSMYRCEDDCPYREECSGERSYKAPLEDTLALIQQLEAEKQQLEGMLTHMNQLRDAAAGRALKMEERVRQLETDNSQLRNYIRLLQTERDAAIHDMNEAQSIVCLICKNYYQPDPAVKKYGCKVLGEHFGEGSIFCGMFEWRGVQKEE